MKLSNEKKRQMSRSEGQAPSVPMPSNPARLSGVLSPHVPRTRQGLVTANARTNQASFSQQASHGIISASGKSGNMPYDPGSRITI